MKHHILPEQGLRTIHTPAIFDSGAPHAAARASAGIAGSTALIEAVHIRGPIACQPNDDAPSRVRSRP